MTRTTTDGVSLRGAGIVTVLQPARGHRFTLDSVLLADFCRIRQRDRVLELGAGTGVISLLLAKKHPNALFTAVEIRKEAADICRRNAHANGLADRLSVVEKDIACMNGTYSPGAFDAVVANPPYAEKRSGRNSPLTARLIARHAEAGGIAAWVGAGSFLRNRGRFSLVFAASRTAELLSLLRGHKLEPKRLRFVHAAAGRPASLVLVESVRSAAPGVHILPPLITHDDRGEPTRELRSIYAPGC